MMENRGQSTIDFAIGASLFLLTTAFVLGFVPSMLQPFTGGQDNFVQADRAANQLSKDLLGSPSDPYILDDSCTDDFFAGAAPPPECDYGSSDPHTALGLPDRTNLNITIERDGAVVLGTGQSSVPETANVVAAQRSVLYDGKTHQLYVRVW